MPSPPATVPDAYADLLLRHGWQWFATLTFSPTKRIFDRHSGKERIVDRFHPLRGMHLEAADKAFRWWTYELNKRLYGNHWDRKPQGGVCWARGQEFHKSGRVHFHAVLAAVDGDLNELADRYAWHELWYREFGRNQIERPTSQEDVAGYVSKYVTKGGEVDFSANFGRAPPPQLFSGVQQGTAGVPRVGPAPADGRLSTRAGQGEGQGSRPVLSLTLPVRPQETQLIFTNETFFETETETTT